MASKILCERLDSIKQTEGGKKIMSWYPDGFTPKGSDRKHTLDWILKVDLKRWREVYGKGMDDFPKTKSAFSHFLNRRKTESERERQIADDTAYNLYNVKMAFGPVLYRDILDDIAQNFIIQLDAYQNAHSTYSRERCYRELGGFDGVMDRAFKYYDEITPENLFNQMCKDPSSETEERLNEIRSQAEFRNEVMHNMVKYRKIFEKLAIPYINDYESEIALTYRGFTLSEDIENAVAGETDVTQHTTDGASGDSDNLSTNEKEGNVLKGDRYVDVRTLDLNETISVKARRVLSKIDIFETNGKPAVTLLGKRLKMSPRSALIKLMPIVSRSTPQSFMDDLRNAAEKEPWIWQLVYLCENDPAARTAVFTDCCRAEHRYFMVASRYNASKDRYTFYTAQNNSGGSRKAFETMLDVNQRGIILGNGKYSIYNGHGIIEPLFNKDGKRRQRLENGQLEEPGHARVQKEAIEQIIISSLTDEFPRYYYEKGQKKNGNAYTPISGLYVNEEGGEVVKDDEGRYIVAPGSRKGAKYMRFFLAKNPRLIRTLAELCQGVGLDVSESMIRKAALEPIIGRKNQELYGSNKLKALIERLPLLYYSSWHNPRSHYSPSHGKDFYRNWMSFIFGDIFHNEELDDKAVFGTRSYQTYSASGLLHQLGTKYGRMSLTLEGISADYSDEKREAWQRQIWNDFLRYEGYSRDLRKKGDFAFVDERHLEGMYNNTHFVTDNLLMYMFDGKQWQFVRYVNREDYDDSAKVRSLADLERYAEYYKFEHAIYHDDGWDQVDMDRFVGPERGSFCGKYPSFIELENRAGKALDGWLYYMVNYGFNPFRVNDMMEYNTVQVKDMKDSQVDVMQWQLWRDKKGVTVPVQADYAVINFVELLPGMEKAPVYQPDGEGGWKEGMLYQNGHYSTECRVVQDLAREVSLEMQRIEHLREELKDPLSRLKGTVYGDEGVKFHIFPEFNTNGFEAQLREMKATKSDAETLEWMRQQVAMQLWKIYRDNLKRYTDLKCFESDVFAEFTEEVDDGFGGKKRVLTEEGRLAFQAFVLGQTYARQQMAKLYVGGLCHFDDKRGFEKRLMMLHAPRSVMDTEARWLHKHGNRKGTTERVFFAKDEDGDYCQRVVYLGNVKEKSAYLDDITKILDELKKEGRISEEQYSRFIDDYRHIDVTDGQGFRTLDSYRAVRMSSSSWTDELELAYQKIIAGTYTQKDVQVFLDTIKPVFTGYESVPMQNGGLVKMPVLHKYSECVLLPIALANSTTLQNRNTPLRGLALVVDELKKKGEREWKRMMESNDEYRIGIRNHNQEVLDLHDMTINKYNVDLFLFQSGCKVGGHSVCDAFEQRDENGVISTDTIGKYLLNQIEGQRDDHRCVHNLKWEYYGISASLPGHAQDSDHTSAEQAIRVARFGIEEGEESKLTLWSEDVDEEGHHRTRKMPTRELLNLYDNVELTNIIDAYRALMDDLGSQEKLMQVVEEEIGSHSYNNEEIRWAFARLDDGSQMLPLFSPKIQKEVQNILMSIIRKRLTRKRMPGTGLVQVTSLGLDRTDKKHTMHYWKEIPGCTNEDRPPIKFSGEGRDMHIEYIGIYLPCPNSRLLERFKEPDGSIPHDKLYRLVDEGLIPESFLCCYGYRTPSDAPHSVLPFKIWGFTSPSMGASAEIPMEVMKLTGHDFDGDKLWVHFKHLDVLLNDEVIRKAFEARKSPESNLVRAILDDDLQKQLDRLGDVEENSDEAVSIRERISELKKEIDEDEENEYRKFRRTFKRAVERNRLTDEQLYEFGDPFIFSVPEYDYTKYRVERKVVNDDGTESTVYEDAPWMATWKERNNAKMDTMFALLTSPGYTRRMLICGGADESKSGVKTIEATRQICGSAANRQRFGEMYAGVNTQDTASVYDFLQKWQRRKTNPLTVRQIDSMIDEYSSSDSVFSPAHYGDAFQYMVGSANMIGIYAMYNSALAQLHEAGLTYMPYEHAGTGTDRNGKKEILTEKLKLFRQDFNNKELCPPTDIRGLYNFMASSRIINVAVDNGKDPLLGFVNQNQDFAPLTALMFALGLTEEQVHLFMCQPAMQELAKRKKLDKKLDLKTAMQDMTEALTKKFNGFGISYSDATTFIGNKTELDYARWLATPFDRILNGDNSDGAMSFQAGVLMSARQMWDAAEAYSKLVQLFIRPESGSGSVADTICNTLQHLYRMDRLAKSSIISRIGNAESLMRRVDVEEDDISETDADGNKVNRLQILYDKFKNMPLKKESALNHLELRAPIDFILSWYFPQAKETWRQALWAMGDLYGDERDAFIPDGTFDRITRELMLYMILSSGTYSGNVSARQVDLVIDLPKRLQEMQQRIQNEVIAKGKKETAIACLKEAKGHEDEFSKTDINMWEHDAAVEIDETLVEQGRNSFLAKLDVLPPSETSTNRPRISLNHGGRSSQPIGGSVSEAWSVLERSKNPELQKLAQDLFEYSLFTTGVGYGMYEFGHFAPMNVILHTANYRRDMLDLLKTRIDVESEAFIKFKKMYAMNHWKDVGLVSRVGADKLPNEVRKFLGFEPIPADVQRKIFYPKYNKFYLVLNGGKPATLMYVDEKGTMEILPKTGVKAAHGYTFLQYNPDIVPEEMKPLTATVNDTWKSYRSDKAGLNVYAQSNFRAKDPGVNTPPSADAFGFGGGFVRFVPVDNAMPSELNEQTKQQNNAEQKVASRPANVPPAPPMEAFGLGGGTFRAAEGVGTGKFSTPAENASYEMDSQVGMENASEQAAEAENMQTESKQPTLPEPPLEAFGLNGGTVKLFSLAHYVVDENGNKHAVVSQVPGTPGNILLLRKQKTSVELNKRLRAILEKAGVCVGEMKPEELITYGNVLVQATGVTEFDSMQILANGLVQLIKISNDEIGEASLPEEFAHVCIEMLGHNHPLVARLLNELSNNQDALKEAFGAEYDAYMQLYDGLTETGKGRMILEAAGKLVARALIENKDIKTSKIRRLIENIKEFIKMLLRKIKREELEQAITESEGIANQIAAGLLTGRLADQLKLENISATGKFYNAVHSLESQEKVLKHLTEIELKRASIIERRLGHNSKLMENSDELHATEDIIDLLVNNARNLKTEEVIVNYMQSALMFLKNSENELNELMKNGTSPNTLARKLSFVRDTIESFSIAVEAVRGAITDGELTNTEELESNIDAVSGIVEKYAQKADNIGMVIFEGTLEGSYGKDGLKVTSGKNKGRVITIHEMATQADGDISFASRWLNSLADCDDYVLKAIDDIVRNAKYDARERAQALARRADVAMKALMKATGSRDQSFMFEMSDGKRTGKYISEEAAKRLPVAKRRYYDEMMSIKKEADKFLPESVIRDDHIICIPKSAFQQVNEADGVSEKWDKVKEWIDRSWKVDDLDDNPNRRVITDFANNRVDMLPLKYINKAPKASYDDMTDDVASSLIAYAGMAMEHSNMYGVLGILENARYMSSKRDVKTNTGGKGNEEHIEYGSLEYTRPFTVKQARTRIQSVMDDYFQMMVYGHMQKAEGAIGDTKIDKRKAAGHVQWMTSLSQMAFNLSQRITNVTTGLVQQAIDVFAGNPDLGFKNMMKAVAEYVKQGADRIAETGADESHNKLSLFVEKFDIGQKENDASRRKAYGKSWWRKAFNTHIMYAFLSLGEDYLSSTTGLAVAYNTKLRLNGKSINLYDAYEVKYLDEANRTGAYLEMKQGVTKEDGTAFSKEDEFKFMKKVAGINFKMQGIYNLDDRSAIQQTALGSLVLMYRKWIAPSVQRRYGKAQYNKLTEQYEEGFYKTSVRYLADIYRNVKEDGTNIFTSVALNWNKLTDYERTNVRRAVSELGICAGILLCIRMLQELPPDEENDARTLTWQDNFALYQLLRLRNEVGSLAPTPMLVQEGLKILGSPIPALNTLKNGLRVFELLNPYNYTEESVIKSGRFKGHTKAYKYFWSLPILSMRKSVENFIDPSPLINYYK